MAQLKNDEIDAQLLGTRLSPVLKNRPNLEFSMSTL